jgi:hypothetical protein
MKTQLKLSSILTALLLTMHFGAFAQVPNYVPQNGLVGWWPFNGNANDESGNGNNGTVYGATLTSNRMGIANSAYEFDGLNDYIDCGDINQIDGQNTLCINVWIKSNRNTSYARILGKEDSNSNLGINIKLSGPQDIGATSLYQITSNIRTTSLLPTAYSGFTPDTIQWHMITLIFNGNGLLNSDKCKIFIDGALSNSNYYDSISNAIANTTFPFWIGGIYPNPTELPYDGLIDDIGIWNRALTQQEVANLYNASLPSTSIPIFNCPGAFMNPGLANGLVGWWPFCGDAEDESGNGNNGTVNGATLTSDRFGNANSAYNFNGNNYITVSDTDALDLINDFTLSTWFIADSFPPNPFGNPINMLICKRSSNVTDIVGALGGHGIWDVNGVPEISTQCHPNAGPQNYPGSAGAINQHQWYQFVTTYDDANDSVKYYLNGSLVFSSNLSFDVLNTPYDMFFGGLASANSYMWFGRMDDIGIWNRALDSSEVVQLYNTGIGTQTVSGSCDTLIFDAIITSFNPVTYANHVLVYPNPARDNITIDCGSNYTGLNGYRIRIYNILGQPGQYVYDSPINSQYTYISMASPWVNGTYIVEFLNPQGTVIDAKKIIVQ